MKSLALIPGLIITAVLLGAIAAYEFGASLFRTLLLGESAEEQEGEL